MTGGGTLPVTLVCLAWVLGKLGMGLILNFQTFRLKDGFCFTDTEVLLNFEYKQLLKQNTFIDNKNKLFKNNFLVDSRPASLLNKTSPFEDF